MDPNGLVKGKFVGICMLGESFEKHTGHADAVAMRGIYSEHTLSADSHDVFTPSNNQELRCTPKRELDFVVGEGGIDLKIFEMKLDARPTVDASTLVNERNIQTIAELMEKQEAKRAGLHIAEVVALRLYTGKIPIEKRVNLSSSFVLVGLGCLWQLLNHLSFCLSSLQGPCTKNTTRSSVPCLRRMPT
jgi:hypothetical protein